jgi:excisionase family DNA binding protein
MRNTAAIPVKLQLDPAVAESFGEASRIFSEALDHPRAERLTLSTEDETGEVRSIDVDPATLRVLAQVLALMATERSFTIAPDDRELTTNQAANILNVSRPFFCKLLDEKKIDHRMVGRHRRVLLKDVMAYQLTMRRERSSALDDLVDGSQSTGLYDL